MLAADALRASGGLGAAPPPPPPTTTMPQLDVQTCCWAKQAGQLLPSQLYCWHFPDKC